MGKTFKTPASFDAKGAIKANRRLIDRYHSRLVKQAGNPFLIHPTDQLYPDVQDMYDMFGADNVKIRQLTPAELRSERIEQMERKYAGK